MELVNAVMKRACYGFCVCVTSPKGVRSKYAFTLDKHSSIVACLRSARRYAKLFKDGDWSVVVYELSCFYIDASYENEKKSEYIYL